MINPYEAPQTVEQALPMAVEASAAPPSHNPTKEGLLAGFQRLSDAGWSLAFAGLGIIVLTLLVEYAWEQRGFRRAPLPAAIVVCAIITFVTFVWGFFKNLFAYDRLIKHAPDQAFENLYWMCQLHGWLRLGGIILSVLLLPSVKPQPGGRNFIIALCAVAMISMIHSVVLHRKAIRWWHIRFAIPQNSRTFQFFELAGIGGAIVLFCGAAYFFENHEHIAAWYVILITIVLGIAAVAYARLYRQLAQKIAASSEDEAPAPEPIRI